MSACDMIKTLSNVVKDPAYVSSRTEQVSFGVRALTDDGYRSLDSALPVVGRLYSSRPA